ncbi:MAG: M6 family metalloprotease domain-containing protein [Luteolibacter sp.]|uniref:M6 family metalloprotease domain-containing protein n=1 Tax=Luteolibacter sp. TaxID=1962973 RepID=UPI003262EE48
MKKSKTFRPLHLLVLLAGCISYATAAPFGPDGRETSWTQPNGQVVQLRVFGDEHYARTETPAGFTLVFNDADSTYYYANLSADGNSLVPTQIRAEDAAPAGLEKHIDLSKAKIQEISDASYTKFDAERDQKWSKRVQAVKKIRNAAKGAELRGAEAAEAKINAAPVIGDIRGLTILIQFPNDPATGGSDPIDFPTDRSKIVRFCNAEGYNENGNTGSVRDFYSDQSLGQLTYTQTVTQIVTVPHPRNYYNYSNYPTNTALEDSTVGARKMISDAVNMLQADNFDFSSLTTDAGGRVLATNIFFAGPDSGVYARGLWPHQYRLIPNINVGTGTPIILSNYQITNIPNAAPVIGTFCHENGHLICGYPDIYSSFNGEGVGEHCLMGSGNYLNGGKTPSPINAYFKDIVGWGNVTDIAADEFLTASLPTTGNIAYRIFNNNISTEFFMVENRGNGDKWAQYSDDKGIAIWHIDETINGNNGNAKHYEVALEQADGKGDLEAGRNRGDDGDLFDLGKPKFTDSTKPDAHWWDGKKSFIDVEVVSPLGANTLVAFGGVPPDTIIVSSPNGGEVIFKDSTYPISWKSNIIGNVKIDLYKAGQYLLNIAPDEPDDGSFEWIVPADLAATSDYRIQISSVSTPSIIDSSDAPFSVTDATFPPGKDLPYGWFKPSFAQTRWEVTKQYRFEGKRSLVSGKTGDGQICGIGYRSNFLAGNISFYVKVSSEEGFDFTRFYIDGVAQPFTSGGSSKGLSGNQDWRFIQFPVTQGSHVFVWSYEKDDSFAGLKDSAWIDGVTLPPGTQEIVIQQPVGEPLVDGKSTTTFPDVPAGDKSKPVTYTIKNTGKADLIDLQINKVGPNSTEFIVQGLKKTVLKPGTSTTFEVIFSPKDYGSRTAGLRVLSNDGDEGTFAIGLEGTGIGLPLIGVNQPANSPMEDEDSRNFGIANVGSTGNSKTFTIINKGAAVLKDLIISKDGANKKDFLVGPLGVISLDPGDSTTFTVTFSPTGANVRSAGIHVASNDAKSGPFDISVSGKGSPVAVAKSAGSAAAGNIVEAVLGAGASGLSTASAPTTGVEVIGGRKYLSLTVAKLPGEAAGVVEVSPNLLDWYSGNKHTTVLIDNAATLKVRDNTPVSPDAKRYIRLK